MVIDFDKIFEIKNEIIERKASIEKVWEFSDMLYEMKTGKLFPIGVSTMYELAAYFEVDPSIVSRYVGAAEFARKKEIDKTKISPEKAYYLNRLKDRYEVFIIDYPLEVISNMKQKEFVEIVRKYIPKTKKAKQDYASIEYNNRKYRIPLKMLEKYEVVDE